MCLNRVQFCREEKLPLLLYPKLRTRVEQPITPTFSSKSQVIEVFSGAVHNDRTTSVPYRPHAVAAPSLSKPIFLAVHVSDPNIVRHHLAGQVIQPQNGSVWEGGQAADDVMRVGYCSGSVRQR